MSQNYVEEIYQLVGSASRCWDDDGVFREQDALAIAERLVDIVREERAPPLTTSKHRRRTPK